MMLSPGIDFDFKHCPTKTMMMMPLMKWNETVFKKIGGNVHVALRQESQRKKKHNNCIPVPVWIHPLLISIPTNSIRIVICTREKGSEIP